MRQGQANRPAAAIRRAFPKLVSRSSAVMSALAIELRAAFRLVIAPRMASRLIFSASTPASAAAFAVGELGDWAVYTFTRRPFSQRILISSLVGAPLDSIVFLGMIGIATPWSVITMSLSKLAGSLLVFWLVRRREQRECGLGHIQA